MRRSTSWLKHHRLLAFFVLAYAISWSSWPAYAAGLLPRMEFLPIGPLAAAVIVIALAEGRRRIPGMGPAAYPVARGLGLVRRGPAAPAPFWCWPRRSSPSPSGASAPGLARLTWSGMLTVFAVRLVNPMDGPLGEEPGFRGYALPLLQAARPPLQSAAILGLLVAFWHLPLVLFEGLSLIGLPTTFAITFLYVWLFNRTGGSVLLTLLFHNSQGTFTVGSFGFTGADAGRAELVYFVVVRPGGACHRAVRPRSLAQGTPLSHRRRALFPQDASHVTGRPGAPWPHSSSHPIPRRRKCPHHSPRPPARSP